MGGSCRLNAEERLATLVYALEAAGLRCLIMGGHAVRHYGLERFTNDFDLTVAPEGWERLSELLVTSRLIPAGAVVEGNSWRPDAFRRFRIGTLSSGQEEWLEFWLENHLLDPFPQLYSRCEIGAYGGRQLRFLSLHDLIRSKETERSKDWDDIAYLEEVQDARFHAWATAGKIDLVEALCNLRSRRGFDTLFAERKLRDGNSVRNALERTTNPITQAFLLPSGPTVVIHSAGASIEPLVERKLRSVALASPLHHSLVEIVRRRYKVSCQERDRADKETIRRKQAPQ
jgi:hypothetical protein